MSQRTSSVLIVKTPTAPSGKSSSSPSSLASSKRNNKRTISKFYTNLQSPRRMNKNDFLNTNSSPTTPTATATTTRANRIINNSDRKNSSTSKQSRHINMSSMVNGTQNSIYQRRILSDFNVTAISSSTVTPSDYVINNTLLHHNLSSHSTSHLPQRTQLELSGDDGEGVIDGRFQTGYATKDIDGSVTGVIDRRNSSSSALKTKTIDIQISSFSPLSRRVRTDPQFIAIHAGIPTEVEYEETLARKFDNNEKENRDYTSIDATPLEPDSPYWIPIASLTCLPAVIRLPVTARHLRLSFHMTKPSKYIGEAIASIYSIIKAPNFVAPVKYKVTSKQAAAVIFLRCSNPSSDMSVPPQPNRITPNGESSIVTTAVENEASLSRSGLSLVSRIGPSMLRESRNVCAVVLSVVVNKNHNDRIKKILLNMKNGQHTQAKRPNTQLKKEYSWPVGRVSIGKKLDRSGCISAPSDVIWFGISEKEKDVVLKIEWMGAPKKGLTFVHGELFLRVDQLNSLKKGELFTITWVESPSSVPVNRSVQVEDISLHNGYWFIDFSLTR